MDRTEASFFLEALMAGRLPVSTRALLNAVQDPNPQVVCFVDSHNGEVLKLSPGSNMAELARFKTMSGSDPDRFLKVPRPTGAETYADLDAFCATVRDRKLADRLATAVRGGGTLRDFLDALTPVPGEKERWYRFRESRTMERLQNWLRQNGLNAT